MSKKSFLVALSGIFLLSFLGFVRYNKYHTKEYKLLSYNELSDFHAKRVLSNNIKSIEEASVLNETKSEVKTLGLMGINEAKENKNPSLISSKNAENKRNNSLNVEPENKIIITSNLSSKHFRGIDKPVFSKNITLKGIGEIEYAKEKNVLLNRKHFYAGIRLSAVVGLKNYFNNKQVEQYTANYHPEHISSNTLYKNIDAVTGTGVQAVFGTQFENGFGVETGIGYNTIRGTAEFVIAQRFVKDVDRIESIVIGEYDTYEIVVSDRVEQTKNDTISSRFSSSLISIPLRLNYAIAINKFSPFVSTGFDASFRISESKSVYSTAQNGWLKDVPPTVLNQLSLNVGIGTYYKLSQRFLLSISSNYQRGVWQKNHTGIYKKLNSLKFETGLLYKF